MPPPVDAPAAKRLLLARERAGYGSAHEAADAFGWPDYPLDEGGERPLTAIRAKLYAHAFHVDAEWLVSGKEASAAGSEQADHKTPGETPGVSPTADELAERIGRLTNTQRAALIEFLRAMQERP